MVQVFLTFPCYILRLCSRLSHWATACDTAMAPRLFWWHTHLWWNCCWTGSRRSVSHSFAVCPAHLHSSQNFYASHYCLHLANPGIAKCLHLQIIPWELLVQLGAQQPLCWSINSGRCLLWSKNLFNQISQQNRKHKKNIRSTLGKAVKNMLFTRVGLSAV